MITLNDYFFSLSQVLDFNTGGAKLKIATNVSDAISRGLPVVALESTIISHGTWCSVITHA